MGKKGFTLAELLGVIIVIALLSLIVIPKIIEAFVEVRSKIDDATKLVITEAAKDYYAENQNDIAGTDYCVTISFLQDQGFLSYDLKDSNGNLVPTSTFVKIYKNGSQYKIDERCDITNTDIIIAALSYYNDGNITINNNSSKCITLRDLQENYYITTHAFKNNQELSPTTSIKITNRGSIEVGVGESC